MKRDRYGQYVRGGTNTYNPKKAVLKGAQTAGGTGGLAVLLGILLRSIRVKNPELPWSPTEDVVIVGVAVGLLAGIRRWWRNRRKHKGV